MKRNFSLLMFLLSLSSLTAATFLHRVGVGQGEQLPSAFTKVNSNSVAVSNALNVIEADIDSVVNSVSDLSLTVDGKASSAGLTAAFQSGTNFTFFSWTALSNLLYASTNTLQGNINSKIDSSSGSGNRLTLSPLLATPALTLNANTNQAALRFLTSPFGGGVASNILEIIGTNGTDRDLVVRHAIGGDNGIEIFSPTGRDIAIIASNSWEQGSGWGVGSLIMRHDASGPKIVIVGRIGTDTGSSDKLPFAHGPNGWIGVSNASSAATRVPEFRLASANSVGRLGSVTWDSSNSLKYALGGWSNSIGLSVGGTVSTPTAWIWRDTNGNLLIKEAGGNVGIGTNNPQAALHVGNGGSVLVEGAVNIGTTNVIQALAEKQVLDDDLTDLADGTLTGGKVGTGIDAGNITVGTVGTARLGSGTANSSTYLRGDQTWATLSGSGEVNFNGDAGATNASVMSRIYGKFGDTNFLRTESAGYGLIKTNQSTNTITAIDPSVVVLQSDLTAKISNTPFGSSWNGVDAIASSKNSIYDWAHILDTDDDGLVNVLDQGVGIANTDAGGILQTPITTISALETLLSQNIIVLSEIDTSSELRGILGDESGTGALLFGDGNIGAATATTPTAGDDDTSVATTAFVTAAVAAGGGSSNYTTISSGSATLGRILITNVVVIPWRAGSNGAINAAFSPNQFYTLGSHSNMNFVPLSGSDASNSVAITVEFTQNSTGGFYPTNNGAVINVNTNPNMVSTVSYFIRNGATNVSTGPAFLVTGPNAGDFFTYDVATGLWTNIASTGSGTVVRNTSPTLVTPAIGAATATTPAAGDNDTSVATTAYVVNEITTRSITNIVEGWGIGASIASSILTINQSNHVALVSSNTASIQADFSFAPTNDFRSTDVMRSDLVINVTNFVPGRVMNFFFRGDTNANVRTVTVSTNGQTSLSKIRWNFNSPTNGATSFSVTNLMAAELSIRCVRDDVGINEYWGVWAPVR